jgi:hypothetical protein
MKPNRGTMRNKPQYWNIGRKYGSCVVSLEKHAGHRPNKMDTSAHLGEIGGLNPLNLDPLRAS